MFYEVHDINSLTLPDNAFVNRSLYDNTVKVRLCDIQRSVSLGPPIGNMQYCSIQHNDRKPMMGGNTCDWFCDGVAFLHDTSEFHS